MRATSKGDRIRIALSTGEAMVLRRALDALAAAYRTPPERIDPRVAAVWYSTRGCQSAGMSSEETSDWVRQIHGFKSANLELVEGWLDQLDERAAGRAILELPLGHAEALVGALNDHRLRAAAEHGIGQEEMDLRDPLSVVGLASGRQAALIEIHFLAWVIEVVLRLIAPDVADSTSRGEE